MTGEHCPAGTRMSAVCSFPFRILIIFVDGKGCRPFLRACIVISAKVCFFKCLFIHQSVSSNCGLRKMGQDLGNIRIGLFLFYCICLMQVPSTVKIHFECQWVCLWSSQHPHWKVWHWGRLWGRPHEPWSCSSGVLHEMDPVRSWPL